LQPLTDGRLIAFTEWQEGPPFGATSLRWFSLADLSTEHEPMPERSLAISPSPDSRRLVLFACMRGLAGCGLYLLDVATGEHQRLMEMAFAGSLTWSPDGESLAFLGTLKPRDESSLWVVAVRDSRVIYNAPLQAETGFPPADSSTITWGVQLPTGGRGLENCMAAPKE
jgi:Tol biopolymer transport system component